jgi:lipopolysaccharide export system permease protein
VEDHWLIQPTITMYENGPITIKAEKARLSLNSVNESLMIELVKYELDSKNKLYFNGGKDSNLVELPLSKAAQKNSPERSASLVSLRDMGTRKRQLEAETELRRDQLLTRSSIALASGRLSLLQDASANGHRGFLDESSSRMHRLNAEPWRRWAQGFSCFCFVWVGIPLAILRRSADYTATFAVCFLPILLLYYPLFSLGVGQSKSGDWHPSAPWIANIVLFVIGAWMLRRVYCE